MVVIAHRFGWPPSVIRQQTMRDLLLLTMGD